MPRVGVLHRQIQARQIDTIEVKSVVDVFVNAAGRILDDIDTILPEGDARFFVRSEKCRKIELNKINYAKGECIRIITDDSNRFQSSSHFEAAKLLHCSNFLEYSKKNPESTLYFAVKNTQW
jgi:hypothetical protein